MALNDKYDDTLLPFGQIDDNAFNIVLYEMSHGPLNYDTDRLQSLLYNPIEESISTNNSLLDSLDPDANLINSPPTSKYMVEDEFNNISNVNCLDSSFLLMQINIRSLIGNFDKFKSMLAQIHKQFSVIGVVETWLKDHTIEFVNTPGYKFVSNHRRDKIGGGTGLYIRDSLEYKLCSDCIISDPDTIESLFVEIQIPNGKNIIVGTIYRPPNQNLEAFLDKFNSIISIISKDNKHCYLMGDFNLNLLHYDNHIPTQQFMNSLFSHLF